MVIYDPGAGAHSIATSGACYLKSCGCPPFVNGPEWCHNNNGDDAKQGSAFCQSSKASCDDCGDMWCELQPPPTNMPTAYPTPPPTLPPSPRPTKEPTFPPSTAHPTNPPPTPRTADCSAYPYCAQLGFAGQCCPSKSGVNIFCCPTEAPTTTSAECSAYPECKDVGLDGLCCPTKRGTFIFCCPGHAVPTNPPPTTPQPTPQPTTPQPTEQPTISPKCEDHPQCVEIGLRGQCCPTGAGVFIFCCDGSSTKLA